MEVPGPAYREHANYDPAVERAATAALERINARLHGHRQVKTGPAMRVTLAEALAGYLDDHRGDGRAAERALARDLERGRLRPSVAARLSRAQAVASGDAETDSGRA